VVLFVLLGGALGCRLLSGRALDQDTDQATTEPRQQWQPIDLDELDRQYSASAADDQVTDELFPKTSAARPFQTIFRAGGVDATYVISAWGRERCLFVRVTGPVPNRVRFQERDGDC
jgi:hypothetical protein